jgi:hypothetical protein
MRTRPIDPADRPSLVALDDRTRLPWRFLARHIAIDGLARAA